MATPKPRRRLANGVWLFPPPTDAESFEAAASSIQVPEGTVVIAAALSPDWPLRLVSESERDGTVNVVTVIEQLVDGAGTVVLYLHGASLEMSSVFAAGLRAVLDSHVTRLGHRRLDEPDPFMPDEPGRMPAGLVVSATADPLASPQDTIGPVSPLPARWLVSMPGSSRLFGPVGDLRLAARQAGGNLPDLNLPSALRYRLAGGLPPQGITDDDLAELAFREIPAVPAYTLDQPAAEPGGTITDVLLVPVDPAWTPAERLSAVRRSVRLGTVRVWPTAEVNTVEVRLAQPVRGGVLPLPHHDGEPDLAVLAIPAHNTITMPGWRLAPQDLWVNGFRDDLFVATMMSAQWRAYLRNSIPLELADMLVIERPVLNETGALIRSPRGDRFLTAAEYADLLPRFSATARPLVLIFPEGEPDWSPGHFLRELSRHAVVVTPDYLSSTPGEVPPPAMSIRWAVTTRTPRRVASVQWYLHELLLPFAGGPGPTAAVVTPHDAVFALAAATRPRPELTGLARDAFEEAPPPTDHAPRRITLPRAAGATAEEIRNWLSGSDIAVVRNDTDRPGQQVTIAARYLRSVSHRSRRGSDVEYLLIDGAALNAHHLAVERDGKGFRAIVDPTAARAIVLPPAAQLPAPSYSLSDPAPAYPTSSSTEPIPGNATDAETIAAFPWLPEINPHLADNTPFDTNCAITAIATHMTLTTGDPHQAGGTEPVPAQHLLNHQRQHLELHHNDPPQAYRAHDLPSVITALDQAEPGTLAMIVIRTPDGTIGHVFNAIRNHNRTYLIDGQTGTAAHTPTGDITIDILPMTTDMPLPDGARRLTPDELDFVVGKWGEEEENHAAVLSDDVARGDWILRTRDHLITVQGDTSARFVTADGRRYFDPEDVPRGMAYEHISVPVTETITAPAVILVGEQGPTLEQIDSRKKNIRRILNQARNHQVKDLFDPRDYEINPDHQDLRVTGEMEVLPGRGYLYTQATVGVPLETLHIALDTITRETWTAARPDREGRSLPSIVKSIFDAGQEFGAEVARLYADHLGEPIRHNDDVPMVATLDREIGSMYGVMYLAFTQVLTIPAWYNEPDILPKHFLGVASRTSLAAMHAAFSSDQQQFLETKHEAIRDLLETLSTEHLPYLDHAVRKYWGTPSGTPVRLLTDAKIVGDGIGDVSAGKYFDQLLLGASRDAEITADHLFQVGGPHSLDLRSSGHPPLALLELRQLGSGAIERPGDSDRYRDRVIESVQQADHIVRFTNELRQSPRGQRIIDAVRQTADLSSRSQDEAIPGIRSRIDDYLDEHPENRERLRAAIRPTEHRLQARLVANPPTRPAPRPGPRPGPMTYRPTTSHSNSTRAHPVPAPGHRSSGSGHRPSTSGYGRSGYGWSSGHVGAAPAYTEPIPGNATDAETIAAFPWLPEINPHLADNTPFDTNCAITAI
ncbi:MAG TPA: toxin glutamine deamidase domain-containing protein, partial [Actinoplanes sp.]|nr:toxin glutamine deamidase domain-containing protein [Actinoplanes sp.]